METVPTRRVFTLADFSSRHPSFSQSVLRNLIFKGSDRVSSSGTIKGNGFAEVTFKIGKRIYIDEMKFFAWFDQHQRK